MYSLSRYATFISVSLPWRFINFCLDYSIFKMNIDQDIYVVMSAARFLLYLN